MRTPLVGALCPGEDSSASSSSEGGMMAFWAIRQGHDAGRCIMLRTPVCDVLGIQHPVVQAAIWPATAPELAAAVSNAGGLGSLGAVFTSAESLERQITRVRELTTRPFAVNHVVPLLDEDAFALTLEARPAVISLALGDPGDFVDRAHAAGTKVIHQVHTVGQARQAAE